MLVPAVLSSEFLPIAKTPGSPWGSSSIWLLTHWRRSWPGTVFYTPEVRVLLPCYFLYGLQVNILVFL